MGAFCTSRTEEPAQARSSRRSGGEASRERATLPAHLHTTMHRDSDYSPNALVVRFNRRRYLGFPAPPLFLILQQHARYARYVAMY